MSTDKKEVAKSKTKALLQSRLGIAPTAVDYNVTNSEIEAVVEDLLMEKGIDLDDSDIMIRAVWNPKYDEVIKRKKNAEGVVPFHVYLGVRLSKEQRKNGGFKMTGYGQIKGAGRLNEVVNQIQRLSQNDNSKMQIAVMGHEELQKAAALFIEPGEKMKWDVANKKAGVIKLTLSTNLVISRMLSLDTPEAENYRFIVDIIKAKVFGGEERNFTMQVRKAFETQNYKKAKSNFMKWLG